MKENKHTFQFIDWEKSLPKHQADKSLWDSIESDLDDMENHVNWDEGIGHLTEHRPDPDLWNKIDKETKRRTPIFYIQRAFAAAAIIVLSIMPLSELLFKSNIQDRSQMLYLGLIQPQLEGNKLYTPQLINPYHLQHNDKQNNSFSANLNNTFSNDEKLSDKHSSLTPLKQIALTIQANNNSPHLILKKNLTKHLSDSPSISELEAEFLDQLNESKQDKSNQAKWSLSTAYTNSSINADKAEFDENAQGQGLIVHVNYKPSKFEFNFGMAYEQFNLKENHLAQATNIEFRGTFSEEYMARIFQGFNNQGDSIFIHEQRTRLRDIYDTLINPIKDIRQNNYSFFKIPISMGYHILEKSKYYLKLNTGLSLNILVNHNRPNPKFNEDLGRISAQDAPKISGTEIGYQLSFAFETGYRFGNNIWLFGKPSLIYYPNELPIQNISFKQKKHHLGINIGLRFDL